MSQNITLVANPLPGYLNTIADRESRTLQVGLANTPQYFSKDQPEMGTTVSGPICIEANTSVTGVLQLETRSISQSNGCFSSDLVREDVLCQSSR